MADRARHAFGALEKVDVALQNELIDAYDILFLKDANGKPYVGWIDKDGNKVIVEEEEKVITVEGAFLPEYGEEGKIYIFGEDGYFWNGEKFVNLCKPTDVTNLESGIAEMKSEIATKANAEEVNTKIADTAADAKKYTDGKIEAAINEHMVKKYEITSMPEGALVDYRDKEIRVMCPVDTKWVKQAVGATGNANMYYMGFKAYAPEGAVSFKEGDRGVIIDEMFDFKGDFAGTDEYGRNYSICWLALASYDATSNTWTYFGKNSSEEKFIGWDYVVEWYNADGVIIASDCVRINLSNENCHTSTKPYYVGSMMKEIETKIAEATEGAIEIVEF